MLIYETALPKESASRWQWPILSATTTAHRAITGALLIWNLMRRSMETFGATKCSEFSGGSNGSSIRFADFFILIFSPLKLFSTPLSLASLFFLIFLSSLRKLDLNAFFSRSRISGLGIASSCFMASSRFFFLVAFSLMIVCCISNSLAVEDESIDSRASAQFSRSTSSDFSPLSGRPRSLRCCLIAFIVRERASKLGTASK
mmetsp:Transcript_36961/g.59255  ORF Transcript_36961/g.59255 Transcript_36961/m.59255 type:complete len:202 (-) Transcript_36961:1535-2140(-)